VTSPIGVLFLGLMLGALLCRIGGRAKRLGRWLVLLAVAQAWVFGCGVTTRLVGVPLEGAECNVPYGDLPRVDAVVLLGGGVGIHEKCGRPELYGGADRVWTAAKVFKASVAPMMTVSGSGARGELAFLADMGVGTNKVVLIEAARNTEEEARLIARAVGREKPKAALVTSAWHMPRAKMLFERAGFEVTPVPTDYEMHGAAERELEIKDFIPDAESLVRNTYAVKEWVARFCYWLKG